MNEKRNRERFLRLVSASCEPYFIAVGLPVLPKPRSQNFMPVNLGWALADVPLRSDGRSIRKTAVKVRHFETRHTTRIINDDGETYNSFWVEERDGAPYSDEYYLAFAECVGALTLPEMLASLVSKKGYNTFFERAELAARHRSKKAGREYGLPEGWMRSRYLEQRGRCSISGLPMFKDRAVRSPYQPVIDRIDPSLGYTPENCRLVCHIANIGRGEYDDDTFRLMCSAVSKHMANEA